MKRVVPFLVTLLLFATACLAYTVPAAPVYSVYEIILMIVYGLIAAGGFYLFIGAPIRNHRKAHREFIEGRNRHLHYGSRNRTELARLCGMPSGLIIGENGLPQTLDGRPIPLDPEPAWHRKYLHLMSSLDYYHIEPQPGTQVNLCGTMVLRSQEKTASDPTHRSP